MQAYSRRLLKHRGHGGTENTEKTIEKSEDNHPLATWFSHDHTLTPTLSRKREREQVRAPSPLYSGERVGVRGDAGHS